MSKSHSVAFIREMKDKLAGEAAILRQELSLVGHQEKKGEYTANFPDYGSDEESNAMEVADFTALRATAETNQQRLRDIESALERIANNTYGVTSEGVIIPEERLRANPAATTVIKPQA